MNGYLHYMCTDRGGEMKIDIFIGKASIGGSVLFIIMHLSYQYNHFDIYHPSKASTNKINER